MRLYLCGQAALNVMRYLRATNDGVIPGKVARPRHLGAALHKTAQLYELSDDAQRLLNHVQGRIEALVPEHRYATSTSKLITHVWSNKIPPSAFIDLGNGIYLSSPQFLFLQLATQLSEVQLIMLGMELCGFYSRWKLPAAYGTDSKRSEFEGTTFYLQPALSSQQLRAFLARRSHERGFRAANLAAKRVLDRSASPMETATYLLLCMPRRLGGFGLPAPVLNAKVHVTTSTSTEDRYPDLYWHAQSVDVEYQSDLGHTGNASRYRDARRAVELEAEKITVLELTRDQATDSKRFQAFAHAVRRNLGVRARPLDAEWRARHLSLRELAVFEG